MMRAERMGLIGRRATVRRDHRRRRMTAQATATRLAARRRTAEALTQDTILPAFATLREELHSPAQQHAVTITAVSPTAAELTLSTTPPGTAASTGPALRYGLAIAFDSETIVVKRTVNGKTGSFLGQPLFSGLTQQTTIFATGPMARIVGTAQA
jgi:hypothetical protein